MFPRIRHFDNHLRKKLMKTPDLYRRSVLVLGGNWELSGKNGDEFYFDHSYTFYGVRHKTTFLIKP